MEPKPLVELNHFTVTVLMTISFQNNRCRFRDALRDKIDDFRKNSTGGKLRTNITRIGRAKYGHKF